MGSMSGIKRLRVTAFALTGIALAASAQAVPVIDMSSGQLHGATNVVVQGFAYDVEFLNGTCADIFAGCDHPLDFAFGDLGSVRAAGQALLDQVLLDGDGYLFDSDPSTVTGCGSPMCYLATPFSRLGPLDEHGNQERVMRYDTVLNTAFDHQDMDAVIGAGGGGLALDPFSVRGPHGTYVWARWTQSTTSVPEPSSLTLFGCALMAILICRRPRRHLNPT